MSPLAVIACLSIFVALLIPMTFVSIRESVKYQRREIVKDLQTVFQRKGRDAGCALPSFEFLKYKYFFDRDLDLGLAQGCTTPEDFSQLHWIISAAPLCLTCAALNVYALSLVSVYGLHLEVPGAETWFDFQQTIPLPALVVLSAYAGAMLFMIKAFSQAIHNFDLSPLSFIGAWVNLLLGVASAVVFVFGLMRIPAGSLLGWSEDDTRVKAGVLLTTFVIGHLPELTNRQFLRSVRLRSYKREDFDVYKSFTAVPVEVIDGIDVGIRERLAEFHLGTVQNLAAANPLMLFVETPYGIYQIMDWVAQAQLCCSVGPGTLLKLWSLGIRTIFDLERAVLDGCYRSPALVGEIGRILFEARQGGDGSVAFGEDLVMADVLVRVDNPHVHRLRQIFKMVADTIGADTRKLPPNPYCRAMDTAVCPCRRANVRQAREELVDG